MSPHEIKDHGEKETHAQPANESGKRCKQSPTEPTKQRHKGHDTPGKHEDICFLTAKGP
jgi:hypothetical protein